MNLNEHQLKVVQHVKGPLAVLSVGGAGKTHSVIEKIRYLISESELLPSRIWAVTFTNRAAQEMRDRLESRISKSDIKRIKMSTIHSMAYQINKQGMSVIEPHKKMPTILFNTGTAIFHLFKFCKNENLSNKNAHMYMGIISDAKKKMVTTKNFDKFYPYGKNVRGEESHPINRDCHKVFIEYQLYLKKRNKMDFDDMLVNCYNMLINPKYSDFVSALQDRIEYLIVDEAQDISALSYKIFKILIKKHNSFSLLGDFRQAIFAFIGAEPAEALKFIKNSNADLLDIPINYRSTKKIVTNSNDFIRGAKDVIGAEATTPNEIGKDVKYFVSASCTDEAQNITTLVETLVKNGNEYRDIFILYRVHSQAVAIEDTFIMNSVPYITYADRNFYLRKEIKDLISYIRIAHDPYNADMEDFKRIANKPTRYLSNAVMDKIDDTAFSDDLSVWGIIKDCHNYNFLNSSEKNAIDKLYNSLHAVIRLSKEGKSPFMIFDYILKIVGYEEWCIKDRLEKSPDDDVEMNFDALLSMAKSVETVKDFLELVDNRIAESKKKKDDDGDYVKMQTIHRSKGQQNKIVIVVGACNRIYPFYKAVDNGNTDEEQRIMYVAITRPQKELFISVIDGELGRFKVGPSPYLKKMNLKLIHEVDVL